MTVVPVDPTAPWWAREFADVVRRPEETVPLDEAAVLLAAHASTRLRNQDDVQLELARLDTIAAGCRNGSLEDLRRVLFVDLALSGNAIDYHDPRNSFLPDVLDRHIGIPISLAVVALAVARRANVRLEGVGMPGHFLLVHQPSRPSEPVFLDPFHGGAELDAAGCRALFESLHGDTPFDARFLLPTTTFVILIRMLANLKSIYARARDIDALTSVTQMRLCLPGSSTDECRELIRLLGATWRWTEADNALDALQRLQPDDAATWANERRRLRAQMS